MKPINDQLNYASTKTVLTITLENALTNNQSMNSFLFEFWIALMKDFDKGIFFTNHEQDFVADFKENFRSFIEEKFEDKTFSSNLDTDSFKEQFLEFVEKLVGFSSESFEIFIWDI